MRALLRLAAAVALCTSIPGLAQSVAPDLSHSTIEELTRMEISISSVSRKEENLFHTPAAAYVLTREDIAHSTATSIPELLRSVPGLQVAQISSATWAVSARGFNSAFANKLLVLIDGRTVYSEIYSGEHWDEIDLPLEEIERIEIIRGPGAVVWGTNAVNGVINIITRPARAISSPVVSAKASRINDEVVVQQGGTLANGAQYRGFLSYMDRRPLDNEDGSKAFDGEQLYRAGARLDWRKSNSTRVSVLGGAYGGLDHQQLLPTLYPALQDGGREHDSIRGEFALLDVEHHAVRHSYEVQMYGSDATRHEVGAKAETLTQDVDAVDHFQAGKRFDLVSGAELRLTQDFSSGAVPLTRKPFYFNYLVDGFLQGELNLVPHHLTATFGSKFQDGSLAGFQVQPSLRLSWTINDSQFLWAAVSRSAVAPALQDRELVLGLVLGTADGLPLEGILSGNSDFKPETVVATEIGYRSRLSRTLSLDLATYANNTKRLQSFSVGSPALATNPSPTIQVPLLYGNGYTATSQGAEVSLDWRPSQNLQLRSNYTWLEAQITQKQPGELNITDDFNSPRCTFTEMGRWNFTPSWTLAGTLYRVGAITPHTSIIYSPAAIQGTYTTIPGFTRLDLGVDRNIGSHLQLSAGGTNLTSRRHIEFSGFTTFLTPLFVPRSVFVRARWSF